MKKPKKTPKPKAKPKAETLSDRALGRKLREIYQQARWDASGLCQSAAESADMVWDKVARAARKALQTRSKAR